MTVSIIIPVYNKERFLRRCLESCATAVKNAGCEGEIICVNDGSDDGSETILAEYKVRPGFVILNEKNSGVVTARNFGIAQAKGEWLCFVDADDWLPPAMLKDLVVACNKDTDIVIGDHVLVNGEKETYRESIPGVLQMSGVEYVNLLLRNVHGYIWGKLIRHSICENLGISPTYKLNEDLLMNVVTGFRARKVRRVPCNAYYYRWFPEGRKHIGHTELSRRLCVINVNRDILNLVGKYAPQLFKDGYLYYLVSNTANAIAEGYIAECEFFCHECLRSIVRHPAVYLSCVSKKRWMMPSLAIAPLSIRVGAWVYRLLMQMRKSFK